MDEREAEFRASIQALDPGWRFEIRDSESKKLLAAGTREAFVDEMLRLTRQLNEGERKDQGWDLVWQKESA